jgi:16S rRNA G966 N2-methylase RsmD
MAASRMETNFFDNYPDFYKTSTTGASSNRLNGRYKALIESNLPLIRDKTVLDLASHDGRWSFAAIKNGAKYVIGIEARRHLVENAIKNMKTYGTPDDKYRFITGDVHYEITNLDANTIDTVFLFGFFYHTMNHIRLLMEIKRLKPQYIILDSSVSVASDLPVIELKEEDPEIDANGIRDLTDDNNKKILSGYPTRAAIALMLRVNGFDFSFYDWHNNNNVNCWDDLEDYRTSQRISVVSKNKDACDETS